MGNKIKHLKRLSLFVIVFQVLLILAFVLIYFLDLFKVKSYIYPEYIAIALAAVIFANAIYIWIATILISKLKGKTDLTAASIIGGDVQEAYNFGMVGLCITDEHDNVIWANELFAKRHINIIDTNIFDWQSSLKKLKESNVNDEQEIKIEEFPNFYNVKYISDAGLWIFKDITDHENVVKINKEEAPVLGILSIDNYNDVVHAEDDFNDTATKVKNIIFQYAKDYSVLLRKIKDNQYTMLCNFKNFEKMREDKFSLLDKVREVSTADEQKLTLSIGIAHKYPDLIKLNELAVECLNFAASRGGDQVVVNNFGEGYEYFGGTTEASESSSRIDIRSDADAYLRAIDNASNVLVMGHKELDMDALGACLGIKAMCDRQGVHCDIVIDLKRTEAKAKLALTSSFTSDVLSTFVISPKEALNKIQILKSDDKPVSLKENEDALFRRSGEKGDKKKTGTLLVVVDVNQPQNVMAPELLDKVAKMIVIDHHRAGEGYIAKDNTVEDDTGVYNDYHVIGSTIDASAASTCELIAEYIRFSSIYPKIELPSIYATIMMSGIFLDSKYYKSKSTGQKTFEASTILKDFGADNAMADEFLKDDYEEHATVNKIVSNINYPLYGVAVATASEGEYQDSDFSKAADICLSFKGTHASFVIGRTTTGKTKVSARSDGTISVQLLMEKLLATGAKGGGHLTAAAAIFDKNTPIEVTEIVLAVLKSSIDDARSAATSLAVNGGK